MLRIFVGESSWKLPGEKGECFFAKKRPGKPEKPRFACVYDVVFFQPRRLVRSRYGSSVSILPAVNDVDVFDVLSEQHEADSFDAGYLISLAFSMG